MKIIIDECIISKYGQSCITDKIINRWSINNLLFYLLLRNVEHVLKKCITGIKYEDIDLNYLIFS